MKKIVVDFDLPDYLNKTIEKLIQERNNAGLHTDFYEEDLISECNQALNDGILTLEQVKLIRTKYL